MGIARKGMVVCACVEFLRVYALQHAHLFVYACTPRLQGRGRYAECIDDV